jgi:hypothetical protein
MSKVDLYRETLRSLPEWEAYLLQESGLPGPRGNLELAQAVADEGSRPLFEHLVTFTAEAAPTNDPHEFLASCGVVGFGRLLAEGDEAALAIIRPFASDPRWRLREGVAMALQRWGKTDMPALLAEMQTWACGSRLEQRAAAAALAEPALLKRREETEAALLILDDITTSMQHSADASTVDFKVLQKGLSYCWSVVVAAAPAAGKPLMEKWLASYDPIIRRIMLENLKKNRLIRIDAEWVEMAAQKADHKS